MSKYGQLDVGGEVTGDAIPMDELNIAGGIEQVSEFDWRQIAEVEKFMNEQLAELDRHNFNLLKLTVVLERVEKKKNDSFANQVTLIADWPGENVVVERHAEDLKVAFVDAVERLDQALLRAKEKRRDEQRLKV